MPTVPYVRATHSDGQSWSAAKANLLEAGVNDVSYAPAVRVYHNANQSITNVTLTALAFNSERFDQAGNAADTQHDTVTNNSRLTCRYAGVYQITGMVDWATNTNGGRQAQLWLNNATQIGALRLATVGSTNVCTIQVTALYALAVNDYVELKVYQDSGGALNVLASGNFSPEFMMVRVA